MQFRRFLSVFLLICILGGCSAVHSNPSTLPDPTQSSTPLHSTSAISTTPPPATSTPLPASPTPASDPLVISRENIDQLTYLTRFGDDWINSLSWSPDGKRMAVAVTGAIELYDMQTYQRAWSVNVAEALGKCQDCLMSGVEMAAFRPDGQQLAVVYDDQQINVSIWNPDTGKFKELYDAPPSAMRSIVYSPDGKLLAGCEALDTTTIYVWDTQTGQILHKLHDDGLSAFAIAFSPDGSLVLTGGFDGYIRLWDSHTGSLLRKLSADIRVLGVAFSPNGKYIAATGGWHGEYTLLWDISGNPLHELREEGEGENQRVVFSPQSDLIVTGNDRGILRIYDVASGKLLRSFEQLSWISDIAFSPNGRTLAVGSEDGNVRLWVLDSLAQRMPTPTPQANLSIVSNYAALHPGQYIVYINYNAEDKGMGVISTDGILQTHLGDHLYGYPLSADGRIIRLSEDTNATLNLLTGVTTKHSGSGFLSPDQTKTARSGCDGGAGLEITQLSSKSKICLPVEIKDIGGMIRGITTYAPWSPDGRWLAYYQYSIDARKQPPETIHEPGDGLYLIDIACLSEPSTCPEKTKGPFYYPGIREDTYMVWSPDSQYLAFHIFGKALFVLFHQQNGQYSTIPEEGVANLFAISPDSRWIAYQTEGENIVIQSLEGGPARKIFEDVMGVEVLFWLTGPLLKKGQSFTITPAGDSLNLREAPSLSAKSLKKLRMHDSIQVLDGPIQADGFTWWRVQTGENGLVGWVVEYYGWYAEQQ